MRKHTLTLLMTAALAIAAGRASAQGTADTRLAAAPVTMEMGHYAGPLSSLLAAVAKAAGYEVVLDGNIDGAVAAGTATGGAGAAPQGKPVVYSFTGKPFNEVWPLLMDVYGLSYEMVKVGDQQVLRVSNSPIQKIIKLDNANAADAVNQVKLFFGTPQYSETQQKDAQGNVVGVTRVVTDVKLDSPTLRIIADSRTNSLIVRGTNREIEEVARLAKEIDKTDAVASANVSNPVVQRVYTVKGSAGDITALVGVQYPNLRVTPVGKTGQLVITGPSNQIDAALALLSQVDKPTIVSAGPPIVQRTFTLANAQATEVKETLEGTLKRALTSSTPQVPVNATDANGNAVTVTVPPAQNNTSSETAEATASNGATIIADQRTNSLIVRGTQAQVDQVAELIPTLDKAVPQINVQVHIQEISESAARNLGIDWSAGIGTFTTNIVGGALKAIFDSTKSFTGLNLGATLSALESQGMSKSIYDGSITLQSGQRKQGNQGTTETTSANAAATIKSGGRLEVNIPSSSGNITKQIDYGVIVDFINPQVSSDGTITLGVRSNVSDLSTAITGQTLPNILQFTNREAQTSLAFKSGQTVMLGGLLSTVDKQDSSGVPFLSSLPIIGNLFKTQSTKNEKTQLLITITGNIIQ